MKGQHILLIVGLFVLGLGLILTPLTQQEVILRTDAVGNLEDLNDGPSGNLVIATSILIGVGGALALSASRQNRWFFPAIYFLPIWIISIILFSDYPNFVGLETERVGSISESYLVGNFPTSLATFGLPILVIAACIIVLFPSAKRLESGIVSGLLISTAAIVASLRQFDLVAGAGGAGTLSILAALTGLASLVNLIVRAVTLHRLTGTGPYFPVEFDKIRASQVAGIILSALAAIQFILAGLLPLTENNGFNMGPTLVLTLRSHAQVVFAFLIIAQFFVWQSWSKVRDFDQPFEPQIPRIPYWGFVGAGIGSTFLVPFLFTAIGFAPLVPLAIAAVLIGMALDRIPLRKMVPGILILSATLWFAGNTITGYYDGFAFPALELWPRPSMLLMMRVLAAFGLALCMGKFDLIRFLVDSAFMLVLTLVILPLAIVYEPGAARDTIAVGSQLATSASGAKNLAFGLFWVTLGGFAVVRVLRDGKPTASSTATVLSRIDE